MATKLKVTLTRSGINRPYDQKATLTGLGLKRPNQSSILADTPAIRGMIRKVSHMVLVEAADGAETSKKTTRKAAAKK